MAPFHECRRELLMGTLKNFRRLYDPDILEENFIEWNQ